MSAADVLRRLREQDVLCPAELALAGTLAAIIVPFGVAASPDLTAWAHRNLT